MPSIEYITVFPKRKNKWKYFINQNFKDAYITNTEQIRNFIHQFISPPTTVIVNEYLQKYFAFIININNNEVKKIMPNKEKALEKIRRDFREKEINPFKAFKKLQKEQSKKNNPDYRKEAESIIKKVLNTKI